MNQNLSTAPDRRILLQTLLVGAGALTLERSSTARPSGKEPMLQTAQTGVHTLPPLPFADDALAPVISANTLGFHYGKHHKGYVDTLNGLLKDAPDLAKLSLEELVKKTAGDAAKTSLFNNAGQIWNHTFYWNSMRPKGGGAPSGKLGTLVNAAFGDYAKFKEAFVAAAKGQFGSGWVWLVLDGGKLVIEKTANADTPMAHGKQCLLTCDVWEHAYYLDYQNKRVDYVGAYLDSLVNWGFAEKNLG
ncbi:MAG: superoxide dismutase [Planctomycetes bacterium]|nr:superoxide dismutase [Planctomycetota bacterium]